MKTPWLASGGLFGLLALAAIGEARPPAAPAPGRPSPAFSLPSPHADTIPPLRPGDPTIRGVDRKMVGAGLGMTKKPARYNIPVVVLTPCLDDGTACATIHEATLKANLAEAAEIFRQSGLDLRFDPVTVVPIHNTDVAYDFPSISPWAVDTAISQGLVVPHPEGKTIGTKKMYVPDGAAVLRQTTLTANDRARAAAALTWSNSLVLIARHFGNEYVELDNKWQASVGPGGGYSSIHLPYVAIVENNSPSFLAHEIGHYLDLGHTHGAAPKDLGELQALLKERKDKHAPQLALDDVAAVQKFVDAALDGDALADTAPDPAYWIPFFGGGDPHVGPCTAPDVVRGLPSKLSTLSTHLGPLAAMGRFAAFFSLRRALRRAAGGPAGPPAAASRIFCSPGDSFTPVSRPCTLFFGGTVSRSSTLARSEPGVNGARGRRRPCRTCRRWFDPHPRAGRDAIRHRLGLLGAALDVGSAAGVS